MAKDYYIYPHHNSSITTISGLLTGEVPIAKGITEFELLNYKGDSSSTNMDRCWLGLSQEERNEPSNVAAYTSKTLNKIGAGTEIYIPKQFLNNEMIAITGYNLFMKQQNQKLFMSDVLRDIQRDHNYSKKDVQKTVNGRYTVEQMMSYCQVWVYVRSLNQIIDITRFISQLNTSVGDGGTFSLSVTSATDIFNNIQTKTAIINYSDLQKMIKDPEVGVVDRYEESWFMKYLQTNDIFFIKYEKLNSEKKRPIDTLYVDKSQLHGSMFDMIGLMDSITCNYNGLLNELETNIAGRDLMKLMIEDASFFMPYAFVEGAEERFFINTQANNKYFKRLFADGQFKSLFTESFRSIRDTLGFIMNQLTSTGVLTDNDLFSGYGSDRSGLYPVNGVTPKEAEGFEKNGIHQIIQLEVDNGLDNRRIADGSISNPDGTILEQIRKSCQEPFVEFYGDTYGDRYVMTARQPPFTRNQILDYIKNELVVEIDDVAVSRFDFTFHSEYYTWYQLKPEGSFVGKSDYVFLSFFPAVLIPPYMQVFGNNRMVISSNYISYQALEGVGSQSNVNLFRDAAVNDLIYMIESTIYLPFARKGTIIVKGGDRRIKRGNWIYFRPTDEYFYVTAVSNSIRIGSNDIDRETVITVERGLKRPYIKPKSVNLSEYIKTGKEVIPEPKVHTTNVPSFGGGTQYSTVTPPSTVPKYTDNERRRFTDSAFEVCYFDVIKLDYIKEKLIDHTSNSGGTAYLESVINDNIMNFFMLKMQFNDKNR